MYVEADSPTMLKLYVTKIINSDAGMYSCKGMVDGNTVSKKVQLQLYSEYGLLILTSNIVIPYADPIIGWGQITISDVLII